MHSPPPLLVSVHATQLIFPDTDGTFRRLTWQFWILQALIVAHVLLIAYTDPPPETNSVLVQTLIVR